jgi:ArsR family transcriptional regulator, zinc-responsive transcriptional repressor
MSPSQITAPAIDIEQHQSCFETLANELRLEIVQLLEKRAMNVTELAAATKAERSRVSHSLQILRQCHLVNTEKRGREILYSLNAETPVFKEHKGNLFSLMAEHARTSCATCAKRGHAPFR